MRILVVEDDIDMLQLLTRRLGQENYSVDACDNGADALEYIRFGSYDCVILE